MKILCYAAAVFCFAGMLLGLLISSFVMAVIFGLLGGLFIFGGKIQGKKTTEKPVQAAPMKKGRKETAKTESNAGVYGIDIGDKWIFAHVGETGDIDCYIACKSENGMYYFGDGTYCANENSDGTDCIFLFTKDKMLYRKSFEDGIECAFLLDDGTVVMYDDAEVLRVYDVTGKQVIKKSIGVSTDMVVMDSERAVFYGGGDDGQQHLAVFTYAGSKLVDSIVPDIDVIDDDGEEDTIFGSDADMSIAPDGFIVEYSNNERIYFDVAGNKLTMPL